MFVSVWACFSVCQLNPLNVFIINRAIYMRTVYEFTFNNLCQSQNGIHYIVNV